MEEENVPHSAENIDFQMQGDRLENPLYDNNSSDADESSELVDEENDDGNDQGIIDFPMQGQNYFSLGRYDNEDNDPETIDQLDHSSSLYNSSGLANDAIEYNNVNEFALEMEIEAVPHSAENISFQM